jgi:CheR methyltransferase, all-alpha domain
MPSLRANAKQFSERIARSGSVLPGAKHEMVYGRLSWRIRALGLPGFPEYCALLRENPEQEISAMNNAITANLTSFFRDLHHFDFLREGAIPEWVSSAVSPVIALSALSLPGVAHINRYFGLLRKVDSAKILPGEYCVTRAAEFIVTVLGSCVSACIWDPTAGVGGMHHFMLPEPGDRQVVWGMPDEAIKPHAANQGLPLELIVQCGLRAALHLKA